MKVLAGGMSRAQMNAASASDGSHKSPNMPPKDAATLIILDGDGPDAKMLMGRRHMKHKFMPGLFVFPGGRVDPSDGSTPAASELHPVVENKIFNTLRQRPTRRRARALGLACLRETYEEAGLLLGQKTDDRFAAKHPDWQAFSDLGVTPTLDPLRLIARAITPPGRTRRFDAWFFVTKAKHIAYRLPEGTGPSGELEDLHWLSIDEAKKLELPIITVTVLDELKQRLEADPGTQTRDRASLLSFEGKDFFAGHDLEISLLLVTLPRAFCAKSMIAIRRISCVHLKQVFRHIQSKFGNWVR